MRVRSVSFVLNSASGTQDITIPGFGTPAGVIFIATANTVFNTLSPNVRMSIGFTNGTSQWSDSWNVVTTVATTDTNRNTITTRCLTIPLVDNYTSYSAEASFNSWITDGVRIDVTNTDAIAGQCIAIFFGGSDCQIDAGSVMMPTGAGGTRTISGLSFEPDLVLMSCIGYNLQDAGATYAVHSFGAATNGTSITNIASGWSSRDGQGSSQTLNFFKDTRIAFQIANGVVSWEANVSEFKSDGFVVTLTNGGSGSDYAVWIALKSNTRLKLGTYNTPTSTGNSTLTGTGFYPQSVLMSLVSTSGVAHLDDTRDGYGFAVFDKDGGCYSVTGTDEDTLLVTNAFTAIESGVKLHYGNSSASGDYYTASLSSLNSDGFTLNFTTTNSPSYKTWYLAFEDENPSSYFVDYLNGVDTLTGGRGREADNAWKTAQFALDNITRNANYGDKINFRSNASHPVSGQLSFANYGVSNTSQAPLVFKGYTDVEDDGGEGELYAVVANSIIYHTSLVHFHAYDMAFRLDYSGSYFCIRTNTGLILNRCRFNTQAAWCVYCSSYCVITECNFENFGSVAIQTYHTTGAGNYIIDNLFQAGSNDATVCIYSYGGGTSPTIERNRIILRGARKGVSLGQCLSPLIRHNSIHAQNGSTGNGIELATNVTAYINNNIISNINGAGAKAFYSVDGNRIGLVGNAVYNCTSTYSDTSADVGITYDNEQLQSPVFPFDISNNDFTPNDLGNVLQYAYPVTFAYLDIPRRFDKGAVQRQKPYESVLGAI